MARSIERSDIDQEPGSMWVLVYHFKVDFRMANYKMPPHIMYNTLSIQAYISHFLSSNSIYNLFGFM